jgi:hypothetical protein
MGILFKNQQTSGGLNQKNGDLTNENMDLTSKPMQKWCFLHIFKQQN